MIKLVSYGLKSNPEVDADFFYDVRSLPNPHFEPDLKHKSGLDTEVQAYVRNAAGFAQIRNRVLGKVSEGKYSKDCTIAFGCYGGKHRSVACVEIFAEELKNMGIATTKKHLSLRT